MKCTQIITVSSFFGLWILLYKPAEWLGVEGGNLAAWANYSSIIASII